MTMGGKISRISCSVLSLLILVGLPGYGFSKEYFVAVSGSDLNPGTGRKPFRTIQKAADIMRPGDVCTISAGTYREQVAPPRGGVSDARRITYRAKPGDRVILKGSDRISSWTREPGGAWVWKTGNTFSGKFNPYNAVISGDWLMAGEGTPLGDVFIDGNPCRWIADPALLGSLPYSWTVTVDDSSTVIRANFGSADPNSALTEVVVRKSCFLPAVMHADYLTLSGLAFMQSAPQWSPPGSFQEGMISTFWSKGWIVENCEIAWAKCVGLCSGNVPGQSVRDGEMDKSLGHHVVRNNWIHHCGQAGIAGYKGWGASLIEGNLIEDINVKREFGGMETAGIKLHAAIDTIIRRNVIRRVSSARSDTFNEGIWLDWAGQNARISGNVIYGIEDHCILLEMNHGPQLVDNNVIIGGNRNHPSIADHSEQNIWVHNLFVDVTWTHVAEDSRSSGYYEPHTMVQKGSATHRLWGDWFYNNIFIGKGTDAFPGIGSWHVDDNVYYDGALPRTGGGSSYDTHSLDRRTFPAHFTPVDTEKGVRLTFDADSAPHELGAPLITRLLIGTNRLTRQGIEEHDGTPVTVDRDILGKKRDRVHPTAGAVEGLKAGANTILLEAGESVPTSGAPGILGFDCSPQAVFNTATNRVQFSCRVSDPRARIASLAVDLSPLTGPTALPLSPAGNGMWTASWVIPRAVPEGTRYLVAKIRDRDGTDVQAVQEFRIVGETVKKSFRIPGVIPAADYRPGGSGIGYRDSDTGNNGGEYRKDDVDIEKCGRGGYDVGWTTPGEWLAYDIEGGSGGIYTFRISVSSGAQGVKTLRVLIDGRDVSGPLSFNATDGWQTWHELTRKDVPLTAGLHELRLSVDAGLFNLEKIAVERQP